MRRPPRAPVASPPPRPSALALEAGELLDRLTFVVAAQRAAIMNRNAEDLVQWSAELERLVPAMSGVTHAVLGAERGDDLTADRPDPAVRPWASDKDTVAGTARRLRQQMLVNQELLRMGMAAADHFALAVLEAGASDDAALFSGVG